MKNKKLRVRIILVVFALFSAVNYIILSSCANANARAVSAK